MIYYNKAFGLKLATLIVDYLFLIFIIYLTQLLFGSINTIEYKSPWLFWFMMYLLYYFLPEIVFKRTFGMFLFGFRLDTNKEKKIKPFLMYSIIVLFDRKIFLVIYIFRILFNSQKKLLFAEFYSGLRWENKKVYLL